MMVGTLKEVVMLSDGLEHTIDFLNFKHNLREGDKGWFDPADWMLLFWDYQEFGTDCWMELDISDRNVSDERDWLVEYESREDHEVEIFTQRWRVRVLEYLNDNTPPEVESVFVRVSY